MPLPVMFFISSLTSVDDAVVVPCSELWDLPDAIGAVGDTVPVLGELGRLFGHGGVVPLPGMRRQHARTDGAGCGDEARDREPDAELLLAFDLGVYHARHDRVVEHPGGQVHDGVQSVGHRRCFDFVLIPQVCGEPGRPDKRFVFLFEPLVLRAQGPPHFPPVVRAAFLLPGVKSVVVEFAHLLEPLHHDRRAFVPIPNDLSVELCRDARRPLCAHLPRASQHGHSRLVVLDQRVHDLNSVTSSV